MWSLDATGGGVTVTLTLTGESIKLDLREPYPDGS